jgi:protein MPE1
MMNPMMMGMNPMMMGGPGAGGMNPMMNPMMGMGGMNGMNGNMNGGFGYGQQGQQGFGGNNGSGPPAGPRAWQQQQQQTHHQQQWGMQNGMRGHGGMPQGPAADGAYFRQPVNPGRAQNRGRGQRSVDYKQLGQQ